jgi:hypothetical protein
MPPVWDELAVDQPIRRRIVDDLNVELDQLVAASGRVVADLAVNPVEGFRLRRSRCSDFIVIVAVVVALPPEATLSLRLGGGATCDFGWSSPSWSRRF